MQTSNREAEQQTLQNALHEVESVVRRCEKMQGKFQAGSAQDSLLKNRLHAMYVAKMLLETELLPDSERQEKDLCPFAQEELERALPPIDSIIRKCTTAQAKWEQGTRYHKQFQKTIDTMQLVRERIKEALELSEQCMESSAFNKEEKR